MATPRNDSYVVASGRSVFAGIAPPPAWRVGMPPFALAAIPGSAMNASPDTSLYIPPAGRSRAGLYAYSGGDLDRVRSRLWRLGGGHGDYAGNEVWMLDLMLDNPIWRVKRLPTRDEFIQQNVSRYLDGSPSSTHTYWGPQYIQSRDVLFVATNASVWGDGNTGAGAFAFDVATNEYLPDGAYAGPLRAGQGACWQGDGGDVYAHDAATGELSVWRNALNQVQIIRHGDSPDYGTTYAYDSKRKVSLRFKSNNVPAGYLDHNQANLPFVAVTVDGPAVFNEAGTGRYSITYDPHQDCFWAIKRYIGNRIYKITLSDTAPYSVTATEYDLGVGIGDWYSQGGDGANTYGCFTYVPALKGVVWNYYYSANTYFFPTE